MKFCDYCTRDMSKWNLDEGRILMCGHCLQRLLGYMVIESPQLVPTPRTSTKASPCMGKPWNRKKLPIKWSDTL